MLVVVVDVGHVWSTIYRTYLDREEFNARRGLYLVTPAVLLGLGCALYGMGGPELFWRVLAYAAVFHFVRQQYGFFMLYSRNERDAPEWTRRVDGGLIYLATLYPVIEWHVRGRSFNWFTDGDFIEVPLPWLGTLAGLIYATLALIYIGKEGIRWRRNGSFNLPKNLLLGGTALSWWVGILTFDNDLAFTAINTVAHGIPYLALVYVYGRNQQALKMTSWYWPSLGRIFSWRGLPLFLGFLILIAWIEEGLWDGWVWREHQELFALFQGIGPASDLWLILLVPLLALPQATHYTLDAFIWRMKTPGTPWARILLAKPS